jgi:hypothetical protein
MTNVIYHCVACTTGPCHALNHPPFATANTRMQRKGLCACGHPYRWVECDCKALAEDGEDHGANINGCPDRVTIPPEVLALFQAEIGK